jgi:amino acid adenylation domain-containing protein
MSPGRPHTPAVLSAEDQQILAYMRRQASRKEANRFQIARCDARRVYPLSSGQQGLWFQHQMEPGNPAYHFGIRLRFGGPFHNDALLAALNELIRRHDALRARFVVRDLELVQTIAPPASVDLPFVDLSNRDGPTRERESKELISRLNQDPFDLSQGPLVRSLLIRQEAGDHLLAMCFHHITFDRWSMGVFVRELNTLYAAYAAGGSSPLVELPIQYTDYAVWERELHEGEAYKRRLEYWLLQLADLTTLALPTDRPRPTIRDFGGADVSYPLPSELTDKLRQLAKAEDVTLFMVFLTAFSVMLQRLSGQFDIAIGTPVSNRNLPELEALIGYFLNTLVLRVDLSGDPSVGELLSRVRDVLLDGYRYQDVSFETLVEKLAPRRDLSRSPLFQVAFVHLAELPTSALPTDRRPPTNRDFGGAAATYGPGSELTNDKVVPDYDLEVFIKEELETAIVAFYFRTDIFDRATIIRMWGHYGRVLMAMASDPEQRIGEISLLGPDERREILVAWNATTTAYPREASIGEVFEEQVSRSPNALAVVYGEDSLTYGELDARANRLAHHLRGLGVGPEVLVGLCVERSLEMVVAVLGILKAGGAYVPLDPEYPSQRLAFMLEDTGAPVLLVQSWLEERLPPYGGRVVRLDTERGLIEGEASTPVGAEVDGGSLAYVMYTSGSTGVPKGVCVEQRSVVRLVKSTNYLAFGAQEVFLQFAPMSFDASTLELWGALLNGSKLVVYPAGPASLEGLGEEIRRRGVTVLWLTGALFRQMVDDDLDALRGVRQLLAGGEALSVPHVKRMLSCLGEGQRLVNGYGPTENTTFTCCHVMAAGSEVGVTVPIGRPISNTQVYVLDTRMEPVPVGVPGELYIGGDGLARGYWRREALTAEKFVASPFDADEGARLYRTGDLVRYRADGTLEFLGRMDDQVKLRGFRIELGEIESVLGAHAGVRETVVLCREDTPGDKRLVAYLTAADPSRLSIPELGAHLRRELPEYMVPAVFVVLEALPVTPNGKLDRGALPAPDGARRLDGEYVAPRGELEARVAAIWRELLRVEQIGVHDDFFELGGHSLMAARVANRVRSAFDVEVPLRELFAQPTIAELAACIEVLRAQGGASASAIEVVSREGPLPLSFAQERLWFLDQIEPDSPAYNLPLRVRLDGALDVDVLERSLRAVVERHEALRTTFAIADGQAVQVIGASAEFGWRVTDLSGWPDEARERELAREVREEALAPFDLERGPLLRAVVLRCAAREHVLLVTVHHIVADGWSLGVLSRELTQAYAAFARGDEPGWPALAVQYVDFAVWQRGWLDGERLEGLLGYWRKQLGGVPNLELPSDRQRPPVPSYAGANHTMVLDEALVTQLKALAGGVGATLYMVLLAGFSALLHRYSAQEDIVVGSPIANRGRAELEGMMGVFFNPLVMRVDLSGEPSVRELVGRVRETALGAYEHQDLPFERLVEALRPQRDLSRNPLFQVVLAMQNLPVGEQRMSELTVSAVPGGALSVHVDLEVYVFEGEGQLVLDWLYATDLFDADTIERMSGHLHELLKAMAAQPQCRVGELPLLSAAECARLDAWNATATATPAACVHRLFEAQVERTPHGEAVRSGDRSMSYRELNEGANRLARHLHEVGVGRGSLVGLCVERSLEMAVGILGVLKAGAAYLPLEASDPHDRLAFMLEDASVEVLLTQSSLTDRLPAYVGRVVYLDADRKAIASRACGNLDVEIDADDVAYVVYTSGSTGTPKGVMGTHRGAVNRFVWMWQAYPYEAGERCCHKTTLSFVDAVAELFSPLLQGVGLVIADEATAKDPRALAELVSREGVTRLVVVPSLLGALLALDEEAAGGLAGVRHWVSSGERLAPELERAFHARFPNAVLVNLYGSSEVAGDVTYFDTRARGERGGSLIGRPIANTFTYVLDGSMGRLPPGVPGELYVGGAGLARGYLKRADLTAERFVEDPFSGTTGRLYRTGDRVRYLSDGTLEYLGRTDQQVKVRGYRIEPAEVEKALARDETVREAAVVAEDGERLVAFVVPREGQAVVASSLRAFLSESLPQYMVPSAYVALERLPLTASGKLDRQALPMLRDLPGPEADGTDEASTDMERMLVEIWRAALGVVRVGVRDNFFDLGGHSLLVIRVSEEMRKRTGVAMSAREYMMQDLRQIAGLYERNRSGGADAGAGRRAGGRSRRARATQRKSGGAS